MATKVPYDLGPFDSKADADAKVAQLTALGATCKTETHGGKFWCRVTKEPDEVEE